MDSLRHVRDVGKEVYPAVVILVFLIATFIHGIVTAPEDTHKVEVHAKLGPGGRPLPQRRKSASQVKEARKVKDFSPRAKFVFVVLSIAVFATFVLNSASTLIQIIVYREENWWPGQAAIIYLVASDFVWGVVLISIADSKPSPTWIHLLCWTSALPLDLLIVILGIRINVKPHNEPQVGDVQGGRRDAGITGWETAEVTLILCRVVLLLLLSGLYLVWQIALMRARSRPSSIHEAEDQQPLLDGENGQATPANGHPYGTTQPNGHAHSKEEGDGWAKPKEAPQVSWFQYLRGFWVLAPYLWPAKSRKLQMLALSCFTLMVAQRVVNVVVPILSGKITDALTGAHGGGIHTPWLLISLFIFTRWLQGGQGILASMRTALWIPVEQYSFRAISTAAFEHVHGLSAEFHANKRTGELISALNKGSSINQFLTYVVFQVGPMIFDLFVAVAYLTYAFDVYLGLVVAIVTFTYIYVTIRLAQWRVELRRDNNNADREMEAVKNDSLHSWDTVKYFNAEAFEFARYTSSIHVMQRFGYWLEVTLAVMNTTQGAIFTIGLLVACFIEAYEVAQGHQSVGKFVLLITYMAQLQSPLNFFGSFYRAIQSSLINAERMLELFKEQPTVFDKPTAIPLDICTGEVRFEDVSFGYDQRKSALNNLSFTCKPGTTTALVGESGGGKTTVFRMLFRYYNPSSGRIVIDNQDVQDLTISSLRQHIGVVPQDCNMFNESIMYNLRYANQSAPDDEIFAACRAASIHDRILAFPDGYDSKVGERGVKLSGGERQRIAIARTILKNPAITLLDEATAALDTETEERIQEAFAKLSHGRTMLMIAHRLSTVTDADQILVLHGGRVIESGTHEDLIALDGKYASMWRKQSRTAKARIEAAELRSKAKKALEDAEVDSAYPSADEGSADGSTGGGRMDGIGGRKKRGHKRVNFSDSSTLGKTRTADTGEGSASGSGSASGDENSDGEQQVQPSQQQQQQQQQQQHH